MALSTSDYPELQALQDFVNKHNVTVIKKDDSSVFAKLIPIEFIVSNKTFQIHINDEYDDLNYNNPLLNVVLGIYEFLYVDDSEDFLVWCHWQDLDPNNSELLQYYKSMCDQLELLKRYFPNKQITTFISDLDFDLNSGCMQLLRA